MAFMTFAEMDARDRAYDLGKVRAARPKGLGECRMCRKQVRARFPAFVNCVNRVLAEYNCAKCAMMPPDPDMHKYYCAIVSRSECERILSAETKEGGAS